MKILRFGGAGALLWLLLCLPSLAADDAVHMLREMFEMPQAEWKEHLKSHEGILDAEFFDSIGKRIRWGIENNHVDDAFRFALVGDLAAQVVGRPDNYRRDLAQVFERGQQGRPGPDVYFLDPSLPELSSSYWPPEYRRFVDAQILEAQRDLEGAYGVYRALARSGYMPSQTWYRAALISRYLGRHRLAAEEFALAERNGEPDPQFGPLDVPGRISPTPILPDSPYPEGWPAGDEGSFIQIGNPAAISTRAAQTSELGPRDKIRLLSANFNPADLAASREMGSLLYRVGNLDTARSVYDRAVRYHALDPELLRGRANTLERLFDRGGPRSLLQAAVADYRKAAALAPTHNLLPWELERAEGKLRQ